MAVIILVTAICSLVSSTETHAGIPVRSAIVYNLTTGALVYQKNPDTPIPPASLTKLMTSMLVHDALHSRRISLHSRVRISAAAAYAGGSTMRLRPGERITVQELLVGMLVASGNDAATALAERVGGSQAAFVAMMNARARTLGMRNTRFVNPTGLPAAGQITTARDMARLARAYMAYCSESHYIHSIASFRHGRRVYFTTNPLLGEPGVDGLKTGFTDASGYNIIVTCARNGTRLLIVVLGGRTKGARNAAARELLYAGFQPSTSPLNMRIRAEIHRPAKKKPARKKLPRRPS